MIQEVEPLDAVSLGDPQSSLFRRKLPSSADTRPATLVPLDFTLASRFDWLPKTGLVCRVACLKPGLGESVWCRFTGEVLAVSDSRRFPDEMKKITNQFYRKISLLLVFDLPKLGQGS
jgi:hypothetical protein